MRVRGGVRVSESHYSSLFTYILLNTNMQFLSVIVHFKILHLSGTNNWAYLSAGMPN